MSVATAMGWVMGRSPVARSSMNLEAGRGQGHLHVCVEVTTRVKWCEKARSRRKPGSNILEKNLWGGGQEKAAVVYITDDINSA